MSCRHSCRSAREVSQHLADWPPTSRWRGMLQDCAGPATHDLAVDDTLVTPGLYEVHASAHRPRGTTKCEECHVLHGHWHTCSAAVGLTTEARNGCSIVTSLCQRRLRAAPRQPARRVWI